MPTPLEPRADTASASGTSSLPAATTPPSNYATQKTLLPKRPRYATATAGASPPSTPRTTASLRIASTTTLAVFDRDYVREHITHGYAVTVHSAQGVTADSTHAVLGENTTRSMLYVAMTRGRETNGAYIYETATEQEYGLDALPGAHAMCRGTAQHAGRLARAIIANHDQPITAHEVATQTPSAALPERVRRIHHRRAAMVRRRRATYQSWQADAQSFARAMTTARERHNSRSRDQSVDCGIEM
jgi:hypothetical protein